MVWRNPVCQWTAVGVNHDETPRTIGRWHSGFGIYDRARWVLGCEQPMHPALRELGEAEWWK